MLSIVLDATGIVQFCS